MRIALFLKPLITSWTIVYTQTTSGKLLSSLNLIRRFSSRRVSLSVLRRCEWSVTNVKSSWRGFRSTPRDTKSETIRLPCRTARTTLRTTRPRPERSGRSSLRVFTSTKAQAREIIYTETTSITTRSLERVGAALLQRGRASLLHQVSTIEPWHCSAWTKENQAWKAHLERRVSSPLFFWLN